MRIKNIEHKERINNKTVVRFVGCVPIFPPALHSPLHGKRCKHVWTYGSCVRLNNRMKQQNQSIYAIVPAQSMLKQGEVTNQQLANGFEKWIQVHSHLSGRTGRASLHGPWTLPDGGRKMLHLNHGLALDGFLSPWKKDVTKAVISWKTLPSFGGVGGGLPATEAVISWKTGWLAEWRHWTHVG